MFSDTKKCPLGLINPSWKSHPIWTDAVIVMPMLEGGGRVTANLIKSQSPGDLTSGAVWGSNEYGPTILLADNDLIDTQRPTNEYDWSEVTFMFWISTTSTNAQAEWIATHYVDGSNSLNFGRDSNIIQTYIKAGGDTLYVDDSPNALNDGKLHQFMTVSGPNGGDFYLDGVFIGNDVSVVSGEAFDANPILIGDWTDGWQGPISSAVFWDRPLNAIEAYEMYRRGPTLGLNDRVFDMPLYGAISAAGSTFNPAWALNSNQVL